MSTKVAGAVVQAHDPKRDTLCVALFLAFSSRGVLALLLRGELLSPRSLPAQGDRVFSRTEIRLSPVSRTLENSARAPVAAGCNSNLEFDMG